MALRADDDVKRLVLGEPQIVGQRGGIEVEIGVDERDEPAAAASAPVLTA
jgi:hypothetical protein